MKSFYVIAGLLCCSSVTWGATPPPPKADCLAIPESNTGFNTLTRESLGTWWSDINYFDNPGHLSVVDSAEQSPYLRQRFVPSPMGSERVVADMDLEPSSTYQLRQSILFESGFDWGDRYESGKIGFGLRGGTSPTGGQLQNDGFSARLVWQGNHDGTAALAAYVYSSDRTQNLPYGDVFDVEGFEIPMDTWIDISLIVTVNSSLDKADGSLAIWIDDEVALYRDNIQWQSEGGSPTVDGLLYASFHGGNTTDWSPAHTSFARIKNICRINF